MDVEDITFTIIYILISGCIVYPPQEFIAAGLTLENVFGKWLGSEQLFFLTYHIRRICVTLVLYSLLPFGYILLMSLIVDTNESTYFIWSDDCSLLWKMFSTTSLILPIASFSQVFSWTLNGYTTHPVVVHLMKFGNSATNWKTIVNDIETEYRSIDKITVNTSAIVKIIATENWIIKVSPLNILFAHQSDTSLCVVETDSHDMSLSGAGQAQYIKIDVKSNRPGVNQFHIRMNVADFKDLEDRIGRRIYVLPEVKFHKDVTERFIDAFKQVIQNNPRYSTAQDIENCIGCLQTTANVKMQKLCETEENNAVVDPHACANCYCRPMWCQDCLARWFASRQDAANTSTWLSEKCSCPMCRATFCVLDVSLVDKREE